MSSAVAFDNTVLATLDETKIERLSLVLKPLIPEGGDSFRVLGSDGRRLGTAWVLPSGGYSVRLDNYPSDGVIQIQEVR